MVKGNSFTHPKPQYDEDICYNEMKVFWQTPTNTLRSTDVKERKIIKEGNEDTSRRLQRANVFKTTKKINPATYTFISNRSSAERIESRQIRRAVRQLGQHLQVELCRPKVSSEAAGLSKLSLISSVAATLTVWRIASSAWRAAITTLHLITTAVAACTIWYGSSAIWHLTVGLRRHTWTSWTAWATVALAPVTAAAWTWGSHRRWVARRIC